MDKSGPLEWSDWDAETHAIECEAGVGMHIHEPQWLFWDEVVALHGLLSRKIDEANSGGTDAA
jgi:hypothetical protein